MLLGENRSLHFGEHCGLHYVLRMPTSTAEPADARHPVLLFLHGYDEGAPMPIQRALTCHGPLRAGNPQNALAPFLIIAPQLPTRGDLWRNFGGEVRALLTHVHEQFSGDAARSYLTGFSFGGNGVFDLALLQANTWAALWAVDPTRAPASDIETPVWLSFGEISRARKTQFIRALRLQAATTIPHGDRLYLDEGADHVGSATLAYADTRIYDWLLSKTLNR